MVKTRILSFILALVFVISSSLICFAETDEFVFDNANILSNELEESIQESSRVLKLVTGCEFVVVTEKFLHGDSIEDYSKDFFYNLELGNNEKNNGLLLVVCTGEESYVVLPGIGFNEILPANKIKTIIKTNIEPYFDEGKYEKSVFEGYNALYEELMSIYAEDIENYKNPKEEKKNFSVKGFFIDIKENFFDRIDYSSYVTQAVLVAIGLLIIFIIALIIIGKVRKDKKRKEMFL